MSDSILVSIISELRAGSRLTADWLDGLAVSVERIQRPSAFPPGDDWERVLATLAAAVRAQAASLRRESGLMEVATSEPAAALDAAAALERAFDAAEERAAKLEGGAV